MTKPLLTIYLCKLSFILGILTCCMEKNVVMRYEHFADNWIYM